MSVLFVDFGLITQYVNTQFVFLPAFGLSAVNAAYMIYFCPLVFLP